MANQPIEITTDFAILAPVPIMHLKSAVEDGLSEIAFGTSLWEVLNEANSLRRGLPVNVYIYASWLNTDKDEEKTIPPSVTWKAQYINHLDPARPPDRKAINERRPSSTKKSETGKDIEGWGLFWVVKRLCRLNEPVPIHKFKGLKQRAYYKDTFIPEHPLLIEYLGNFQ
ncbi:hypothetical protein H6F93_07375 [Leptolyngbya sp. FACHB-671]|uniref:hypothetical protein n=1 Tax=Leptolyngbya sp. FACHB-671 TaxID=2692812 RepID=UPI001683BA46|nr:hypothetical protein [Leptolyngbya sp. FACHB-671]MBD2067350.1 hypothetical protein [Leptolyngbya sp. FACHB-671]